MQAQQLAQANEVRFNSQNRKVDEASGAIGSHSLDLCEPNVSGIENKDERVHTDFNTNLINDLLAPATNSIQIKQQLTANAATTNGGQN